MPCQQHAVRPTPCAELSGIRLPKALCDMLVVAVSEAEVTIRTIPEQLGQSRNRILPIRRVKAVGKGLRPRNARVGKAIECGERGQRETDHLRLVGEKRLHGIAEILPERLSVNLVGQVDEARDCLGVHGVDIRLPVEARGILCRQDIGKKIGVRRVGLLAGGQKADRVDRNAVGCQQIGLALPFPFLCRNAFPRLLRKENRFLPKPPFHRHPSTRTARWPAILVVYPDLHAPFLRAGNRKADHLQIVSAEVFGGKSVAGVNHKAAEAHFRKGVDLLPDFVCVKGGIPCPERKPAVGSLQFCRFYAVELVVSVIHHLLPDLSVAFSVKLRSPCRRSASFFLRYSTGVMPTCARKTR